VREVHSYACLLAGRDPEAAAGLVRTGYATLAEAFRQGTEVDSPGHAVRRVVRRRWIEHLADVPPERKAQAGDTRLLADLPAHVRTIVVLKAVNGMPSERVARETGVSAADVDRIYEQARTWLGAQTADTDKEWLGAHVGEILDPPPSLVEQLVTEFQPASERSGRPSLAATFAVGVGELDATPPKGRDAYLVDPTADVVRTDLEGDAADSTPEAADEPVVDEPAVDDSGETRRRKRGLRRLLASR
jgi:DNA-directed RNA polymerase specialized sigma24 family protein